MPPLPSICCVEHKPTLLAVYAAWRGVDRIQAAKIMKADDEYDRPYNDPFLTEELAVASLMGQIWIDVSSKAKRAILRELNDESGVVDLSDIQRAIHEAIDDLTEIVDDDTREELYALLVDAADNGTEDAITEAEPEDRIDAREELPKDAEEASAQIHSLERELEEEDEIEAVVKSLTKVSVSAVNNVFSDIIGPAILAFIAKYVASQLTESDEGLMSGSGPALGGAGAPGVDASLDALATLRDFVEARFDASPYWRVVANSMVSNAYHYAYMRTAASNGSEWYRLKAVRDKKTSIICVYMDGKEFRLSAALDIMDAAAADPSPDAWTDAMPWLSPDKVVASTVGELESMGFIVPPFHGNCRTTVQFFSKK